MLVTVVTPSLNGMTYVRECIESTRRQETDRVQVEHIFVDAGSSDGTPQYAQSQGCAVIREQSGIFEALNTGSFSAQGVLLGFLGCDDVLLPGALDAVVARAERSGRRWIIGGCRWIDARGTSRGRFRAPPGWLTPSTLASLGWSCVPHTSTFVHRDLFAELGGFNPKFRYAGDYEFFARALERERFSRLPQVLSCFRRHGGNMSMRIDDIHLAEIQSVAERFAPTSAPRRTASRYLLKAWLNATNPSWFAMKRIDWRRQSADATGASADG